MAAPEGRDAGSSAAPRRNQRQPQECQRSDAVRRDTGPTASGEGHTIICARDRSRMAETP